MNFSPQSSTTQNSSYLYEGGTRSLEIEKEMGYPPRPNRPYSDRINTSFKTEQHIESTTVTQFCRDDKQTANLEHYSLQMSRINQQILDDDEADLACDIDE